MQTLEDAPTRAHPAALRVLRTAQWLHFAFVPLAPLDRSDLSSTRGVLRGGLGIVAASAALGYAYAINAVGDRAGDVSYEKNPLVGTTSVPTIVGAVVVASALVSVVAALGLGPLAMGCVLMSLVASTLYSVGPRAKAYPFLGITTNTLIFVPLLFVCEPGSHAAMKSIVVTFIALLVQNQLVHELADLEEDTAFGDRTTARILGARGVSIASALVGVAAAAILWITTYADVTFALAVASLGAGAVVVAVVRAPDRARVVHRRVAAFGGVAMYAAGFAS